MSLTINDVLSIDRIARVASYSLGAIGHTASQDQLYHDAESAEQLCSGDRRKELVMAWLVAAKQLAGTDDLSEALRWCVKTASGSPRITRAYVKDFHVKQFSRLEGGVRRKSADHFRRSVRETAEAIRRLDWNPDPRAAKPQAAGVMARVFDSERWHEELLAVMGPALTEVFAEGALTEVRINKAVKQLGAPDIEAFFARTLPQWLIDRGKQALRTIFSQDYWLRIHETTRTDIQLTLEEGISRGWTTREIATDISSRHGSQYSLRRGFAVARTECLVADTVVDGANITAAYKRLYHGDLIEVVTDSGRKLTATPNHPMLTLRGWVPLGELTKSDRILGYDIDIKDPCLSGNQDVITPPTTIAQIFDSLAAVAVSERKRTGKPDFHGDGMDGYVDVLRADGHLSYGTFTPLTKRLVNRILKCSDSGQLVLSANSNSFSRSVHPCVPSRLFCCSRFPAVSSNNSTDCGLIDTVFDGNVFDENIGIVLGDDLCIRKIFGERSVASRKHGLSSLGTRTHDSSTMNRAVYRIDSNVQLTSNFSARQLARIKIHNRLFGFGIRKLVVSKQSGRSFKMSGFSGSPELNIRSNQGTLDGVRTDVEFSSNVCQRETGSIKLHGIARLRFIESAKCHVYNLSTKEGYFLANGLYTGNTGSALNAGHQAGIEQLAEETGFDMRAEWLSILGSSTRPSHAALDGVQADDEGMFNLNGVLVPYPSHHNLPASDRVNCQCTVLSSVAAEELA